VEDPVVEPGDCDVPIGRSAALVDPTTGQERWTTRLPEHGGLPLVSGDAAFVESARISSVPLLPSASAIDLRTGQPRWQRFFDASVLRVLDVADGVVVIRYGHHDEPGDQLVGLDPADGSLAWQLVVQERLETDSDSGTVTRVTTRYGGIADGLLTLEVLRIPDSGQRIWQAVLFDVHERLAVSTGPETAGEPPSHTVDGSSLWTEQQEPEPQGAPDTPVIATTSERAVDAGTLVVTTRRLPDCATGSASAAGARLSTWLGTRLPSAGRYCPQPEPGRPHRGCDRRSVDRGLPGGEAFRDELQPVLRLHDRDADVAGAVGPVELAR
jgi:hypothetical protein